MSMIKARGIHIFALALALAFTATVTPAGMGMGFLPMRDIALPPRPDGLPDLAKHLAADAALTAA